MSRIRNTTFSVKFALIMMVLRAYTWLLRRTCKVVFHQREHLETLWQANQNALFALWHGRLFFTPFFIQPERHFSALISSHNDGRLIADFAEKNGLNVVSGSTSQGGAHALRAMLHAAKQKHNLVITPDGPRGPRMKCSMGVIEMARLSGLPILPFSGTCNRAKILKSWDRFAIPLPFSTLHIHCSAPLYVPHDTNKATREKLRAQLEESMIFNQQELDKKHGFGTVIEPAESAKYTRKTKVKP